MKTNDPSKNFFLPESISFTGTLNSDVPGQIAGNINGDLRIAGSLAIMKTAFITGNVRAQEVELWGRVTGFIQCSRKIILHTGSFVKGNLHTPDIHIEEGAIVDGVVFKPGNNKKGEPSLRGSMEQENVQLDDEPAQPEQQEIKDILINPEEDDKRTSWF